MSKESRERFERTWIKVCNQFNVDPKTGKKMNSEKEINERIKESIRNSSSCKLFDGSEIDFQDIDNELIKKRQWFKEKSNVNMLNSIEDVIEEYRDLVRYHNCATERLFNISNNIIILEKYKKDDKILELPTHYAFGFFLSNEYDLNKKGKYPTISNDISDDLREKLYKSKEICCEAELSNEEASARKEIINRSEKFTHAYGTISINENIFSTFSKEDMELFVNMQINSFKLAFKYQKLECDKLKKKLDKYRDSVVSISDDYEKLMGFLKSTNPDIKRLLTEDIALNSDIYDCDEEEDY